MFTITIPIPGLDDLAVKDIKKTLDEFTKASEEGPVRGGVASEGDASAYALVWEWGNARQTKKGPKTVLGINPDGKQVWLSIQAPQGYIRLHTSDYLDILEKELAEADFENLDAESIRLEMKLVCSRAAEKMAELIKDTVPVDSGELRDSIKAMDPDDEDLEKDDDDEKELGNQLFGHEGLGE